MGSDRTSAHSRTDRHLNVVGVRLLPFANPELTFVHPAAVGGTEPCMDIGVFSEKYWLLG
ncbi:hypothetical protein DSM14862_04456 (plasmid) [Sulfitobacter indolifex]|jgi:hypothetical protein|nr:hypothetical protein DSM14862_04456 [Sulfitobacter indolifex]